MEKDEIKQIADYVKHLEERLDKQGYRGLTDLVHLTKLHLVIKRLMDATFHTKDQQLKPLLAILEFKARKCKQDIEDRLAMIN